MLVFPALPAENDFMVIRGRVEHGVVVLDERVSLPEGTEVTVTIGAGPELGEAMVPEVKPRDDGDRMSDEERRRILEIMDRIAAMPDENPGDTFSGADHDKALYGAP
jgi:predicted DNA-binding antitoxin AbrB/MazE fold protein